MHVLSKKVLSDELDTLRRSRTPTVVLTADGEVHTHEEAQVFVHDLGLFVTVQLLEDTPAVLSRGKLCEDHGYSYQRVSGQRPRLTKEGMQNGRFRTSCRSRIIHQFWKRFVLYIATAGLIEFIFKTSIRGK